MFDKTEVIDAVNFALNKHDLKSENDRFFLARAFGDGDLSKYIDRLQAINFVGNETVLDSGCGFGQWAVCLAALNKRVVAQDVDPKRVEVAKSIAEALSIKNIVFEVGDVSSARNYENCLNSIFMYNAMALTPFRETLKIFYECLCSGGRVYFNGYDVGWMLYNIVNDHNATSDFSARDWAIMSIKHTCKYLEDNVFIQSTPRDSLYLPKDLVIQDARDLGFELVAHGGDGQISLSNNASATPFFIGEFMDLTAVFECVLEKKVV